MGRGNGHKKVLKIRYRDEFGIKTRLVLGNNHKSLKATFGRGKVLRIGKVSQEEMYKVGEFNKLPEKLMKEFSHLGGT